MLIVLQCCLSHVWPSSRPERCRTSGGFTLIELLVVIAVIALLVTLIMPSLRNVKEQGYDVTCKSNISKLIPVAQGYSTGGWMGAVKEADLNSVLRCPKGYFENGGNQALNVSGSITEIPQPSTVVPSGPGAIESNTKIFGFLEREGFVLPSGLNVDITAPGRYGRGQQAYRSTSGTIPAGTPVDCYFLKFDPVGSQNCTIRDGEVSLSSPIIGVIVTSGSLDTTDSVIGRDDIAYPTGQNARGFENGAEEIEISNDMMTLSIINFHATFPGEQVRIITLAGGTGSGSYGMNGMANPREPRPDQILLAEYGSTTIFPTSIKHEDTLDRLCDENRLHFGRINVGLTHGGVMGLKPEELTADSGWWDSNP